MTIYFKNEHGTFEQKSKLKFNYLKERILTNIRKWWQVKVTGICQSVSSHPRHEVITYFTVRSLIQRNENNSY